MTIKDVSRPVEMQFVFHGPKPYPFDTSSLVAGFDTSFVLNRLDYHVGTGKFFDLGVVGDKVAVHISIEALSKKK